MQLDFRQFVIQVLRKAKAVPRIEEGPGPKPQTGKVNFLSQILISQLALKPLGKGSKTYWEKAVRLTALGGEGGVTPLQPDQNYL